MLNRAVAIKRVVDRQRRAAGVTKDVGHALGLQRLDQMVCNSG